MYTDANTHIYKIHTMYCIYLQIKILYVRQKEKLLKPFQQGRPRGRRDQNFNSQQTLGSENAGYSVTLSWSHLYPQATKNKGLPENLKWPCCDISHFFWSGLLGEQRLSDRKRLDQLIRKASSVLSPPELSGGGEKEEGCWLRCQPTWRTTPTPCRRLQQHWRSTISDGRIHPKHVKEHYGRSFLPAAVRLQPAELPVDHTIHW